MNWLRRLLRLTSTKAGDEAKKAPDLTSQGASDNTFKTSDPEGSASSQPQRAEEANAFTYYQTEDKSKSVRQIVLDIPSPRAIDSKFGMMFLASKYHALRSQVWVAGYFRINDDPGPYLMVRTDGFTKKLRDSPFRVAHCFYRMRAGGLYTIYLDFPALRLSNVPSGPFVLIEMVRGIDMEDEIQRISDGINREKMHICFAEGDGQGETSESGIWSGGSINAEYDVVFDVPADCRTALRTQWEELLEYHRSLVPHRRDYNQSIKQLVEENPISINPIAPPPLPSADLGAFSESGHQTSESSAVRFTKCRKGIVTDAKSGLEWIVGPDLDTSYEAAVKWVRICALDGGGWRMPTCKELSMLYESGESQHNINTNFKFPGWTDLSFSSTGWRVWGEEIDSSHACYFNFSDGNRGKKKRADSLHCCVFGVRESRLRNAADSQIDQIEAVPVAAENSTAQALFATSSSCFPDFPLIQMRKEPVGGLLEGIVLANAAMVGSSYIETINLSRALGHFDKRGAWPEYADRELAALANAIKAFSAKACIAGNLDQKTLERHALRYVRALLNNDKALQNFRDGVWTNYWFIIDYANTVGYGGTLSTCFDWHQNSNYFG